MNTITLDAISTLKPGDKVKITLYTPKGEAISKQGTFHSIDGNYILVKQYGKQRKAWEIPLNTSGDIKKIKKFENARREINLNVFH